ncbi:unnamed protein product, partial [Mesorhabditis spiculigera]
MAAIKSSKSAPAELGLKRPEKETDWRAIYIASFMLVMCGMNMSIFFMAIWPYTVLVAPDTHISILGLTVSANSLGCLVANPTFGYWGQKTMKAAQPVGFAFAMAAIGNLLYGILPVLPISWFVPAMLLARFLAGIGAGTLGVLRSFTATASAPKDRLKAISISSFGLTTGLSIGPVITLLFMPMGVDGWELFGLPFNQFTTPGYFMFLLCIACVVILITIFRENHVGIISDEEKAENPWFVLPKWDRISVAILFFVWACMAGVGACVYSISSPLTMVMYGWSSNEAVAYNSLLQTGSCAMSAVTYIMLAKTRYGKLDRRFLIGMGLGTFLIYLSIIYPWGFYEGPLNFIAANETTGGCPQHYQWCADYTRVPFLLYSTGFILALGIGFPTIVGPLNALFSEVVGPRKQSFLQGLMTFTGSLCQFIAPLIIMPAFEMSGFRWVAMGTFILILCAIALLTLFRHRMVPLNMDPPRGLATKYKRGTFYKM